MPKPTSTPIDIPLSTLDQLSPLPDTPIGRFLALENTIVQQYAHPRVADGSVTHVRVEQRPAFLGYDTTVKDDSGTIVSAMSDELQLITGGSGLNVATGNRLYTRSTSWLLNGDAAGSGPSIYFPQVLRSRSLYAADSQIQAPNSAMIGNISCTVWKEIANSKADNNDQSATVTASALYGIRVLFRDENTKTNIRPAFTYANGTPYKKVRVVTDGTYFYVFLDNTVGGTVIVAVFDTTGVLRASTTVSVISASYDWDVTYFRNQFVVLALPHGGTGITFVTYTFNGTTLTTTNNTDVTIACGAKVCAWVTSPPGITGGTLLTVDNPVTSTIYNIWAYRIGTGLTANHTYPQVASGIGSASSSAFKWISGMTGYVHTNGSGDLTVAYTVMDFFGVPEATTYRISSPPSGNNDTASDFFPDQLDNVTVTAAVPFTGSTTTIATRLGLSLVTCPFQIGDDWVALTYYPARKWGPLDPGAVATLHAPNRPVNPSNFQPTWYLIPLDSSQPIAGRFEYALAAADWQVIAPDNTNTLFAQDTNRVLTTPCVSPSGAVIFPAGYRVENVPTTQTFGVTGGLTFGYNYKSDNTVGVKQFTIGPDVGRPFAVNDVAFLPGVMAATLDGGFYSEHGVAAFECPSVTISVTSDVQIAAYGPYLYRMCAEYTSRSGLVDRSLPSAAFSFTALNANRFANTIAGHPVYPTLKKFIKASIYRTGFEQIAGSPPTGVSTAEYFKVTNDLQPVYNDPTAAGYTFADWMQASTQATGEELYTDQGFVPRYPAPAFRQGCVWNNRPWLVANDNTIWFGGELNDQDAAWFNPGFRVSVPSDDEIVAVAPMDSFLLILCASSIWYLPQTQLPDATGDTNGSPIPVPIRLPFENGGTGALAVIREGCAYASSTGGAWLITRALENKWLGQSAKDYLTGTISDMVLDGQNRLIVTNGSWLTVYDTVLGGWMRWNLPIAPALITAYQGQTVFAGANNGTGLVWQQTASQYYDSSADTGISPITMSVRLSPLHLGGGRTTKCIWNIQLQGEVFSSCYLNGTLYYDDFPQKTTVFDPKLVTGPGALLLDFPPTIKRSTSIGIGISNSLTGPGPTQSPGRGFALDLIGVLAGVEKGLTHFKGAQRVGGSTT